MSWLYKYDNLLIFVAALFICTSFIGLYPIYILDEARNSEAAREMLVSGNFIVPYFNGQLRTDKPPLHYFFMIFGYKIFGINALGARFFSGVFGALTLLSTFVFVKRYLGRVQAFIVTVILLSSLFFVQEFHLAVPDPYLIFFISFSLFAFIHFYNTKKQIWLFAMYGSIGLGILTKGPIAVALPGIVIPVFLVFKRDFSLRTILSIRPILGLVTIILIALPWYYLVHQATQGEWTQGFFFDHNISRFNSEKEGHGGLFFVTPLFVILGLLPFSVFIIQSFKNAWISRKKDDFLLFSFIVSTLTILFFSISSTKLPNYPMPCYPFVAILLGVYLCRIFSGEISPKNTYWSLWFLLFLSVVVPVGGFVALTIEKQFYDVRYVSQLLVALTIVSIFALYFYKKRDIKKSFFAIATGWILTGFFLFGIIYPTLTRKSPVSMASNYIKEDTKVIVFKRFDSAFPINFNRTFEVFESIEEIDSYLAENPDAFIITNIRKKEDLELLAQYKLLLEQKALFENHTTRIYKK